MAGDHIGLIGIGNIGAPMARPLERGARLTVCDRRPEVVATLRARGATVAQTPREVADAADIVLSSMPSRKASLEVELGAEV